MTNASGRSRPGRNVPLRRLLDRSLVEELLEAATAGGQRRLTLIDADGQVIAGDADGLESQAASLRRALMRATSAPSPIALRNGILVHPLRARSRIVGGLVDRGSSDGAGVSVLLRGLHALLDQALDLHDLGQETLDRYREINLLYRIGETIGAALDAQEIPELLIAEANRAVEADATVVLIGHHGVPNVAASRGTANLVDAAVAASRTLVDHVLATGQPEIVAGPASVPKPVGSILCVPIRSREEPIGAVLLVRRDDRAVFNAGDEKLLLAIAGEGGVAYDRARLHEQKLQRERVDEELAIGRRIQLSLLGRPPEIAGWEFAAVYQAARQVGGDFYDFIERTEAPGTIDLVIGDVTGKGVSAALLMAFTRAVLRASTTGTVTPAAVLERTNRQILRDGRAGLFVTALYGTLELASGRLVFASGGHDPPLWVRGAGRQTRLLTTRSSILGAFDNLDLEDRRIELAPGDALVFYTDGVTEARDQRGRLYGERRLRSVVSAHVQDDAGGIAQAVVAAVRAFAGAAPPSDDLTLLVVKRAGHLQGGEGAGWS